MTKRTKPNPQANAGKPWTVEEDKQLLSLFGAGHTLETITATHGRTLAGIRARLEKHGKIDSNGNRRPITNDDPLCECADCGAQHRESELDDIKDYHQRVTPGEIAPAGECPDCGALCHEVEDDTQPAQVGELVKHCEKVAAFFPDQFPHEHGNKEIGEAWGAADAALKLARGALVVDPQQRATLLAALRYYQVKGQGDPFQRRDDIHEIATDNDNVTSLDREGIETLYALIRTA